MAGYCLYHRVDDEVRCRILAKISGHYKNLKVTARSAHLVDGKGIKVTDLSILDPRVTGPQAELLHIEEAFLDCSTDWKDLLRGEPVVRRVTIRRSTLHATRRVDGSWNTAPLLPPPSFGDHAPEVVIEEGTIEMADESRPGLAATVLRDINWTMTPVPPAEAGGTPDMRRLRGVLAAEGVRRLEIDGLLNLKSPYAAFRGRAQSVEFSPEWRDSLPEPAASRLTSLGDLYGHGDLNFELQYDPSTARPLQFHVVANLVRGRINDPRLPQTLTDIRAAVEISNDGYTIHNLTAKCGQASLQMSCRRRGLESTAPLSLVAEVRQLDLDRSLLAILPGALQEMWRKYLPSGKIDADMKLEYDGLAWRPDVSVRCLNVSFSHYKFPYRLEHGKGTVVLKDDLLRAKLTALAASQPVDITAEVSRPLSAPTGWFEARGDEVPIDETLVSALPEKSREVVTSLDPRGRIGFYVRMWRDAPDQATHQHVVLSMHRCSIRYKKFPYPLTNIRGILEMLDGTWTMRHIEGNNGTARVSCKGQLTAGFAGNELGLNITAREVPLEEELRNSLSPHMQQVWYNLRPRGVVNLTAEVRYLPEDNKFNISVRAEPHRDLTSLEPLHFPYRLDKIQGVLLYRDGQVTVQNARAEHGTVKFASQAHCDFQPDGRWQVRLEGLTVDRLRTDRELVQALPDRLRKVIAELNSSGPVNLTGTIDLENSGRLGDPLRARWDVRLGLQQNNLDCRGLQLGNVCGELSLQGGFDGVNVQSRGELALDSVTYRDLQLTQVMGPIWIDDGRLLFGAWVDRRENGPGAAVGSPPRMPRPVTASLYGGTLYGDGWVTFGAQPRYFVNATLTDADLSRCAKDLAPGQQRLQGKILATADLSGNGFTRNSLSGRGTVRLSQGDVYELPVMISLLKIVSIRPPDQNAFSDATIDYRIEGEHIYFDRIDFHGDAISLRGKGEMDFQSSIRLKFHALVGRGELAVPVIKQVFSGASQQLMLIHVDGTLQNPETRKEALPYVNQALQQIRDELQNRR